MAWRFSCGYAVLPEVIDTTVTPESGKTYYVSVDTVATGKYKEAANLTAFEAGVAYYTYDSTNGYEEVTDTSGTPNSGTTYYVKNNYTFDGLGIGSYVLVESTTPTGYNTMDDLYFTIEAETEEGTDGTVSVTSLTIKDADGMVISTGTEASFSVNTSAYTISTSIKNYAGSMLPSTGGIGTTIFYIVGGVMVVGAVVLFITRWRMRRGV